MEYKDYYKILGVSRDAPEKDIKAAYRRLARKHHPDVNPGNAKAEARFKEINEAHAVLSDSEKRKRYDQLGQNWQAYQSGGAPPWGGGGVHFRTGGGQQDLGGFSEFFRTFFTGGGFEGGAGFEDLFGRQGPSRGSDVESGVELTLEEILRGTTRTLSLEEGGRRRRVEVKIPAGVREGSRVRVAGEGQRGRGGTAGDLYLRVRVAAHPRFEVKGADLHTEVSVPLTTAVLGGEVSVPTLESEREVKVPAGTPPGRVFRLRGLGLPSLEEKGRRGDVLASVAVRLPETVSERERELFEQLRDLGL